MPPTGPGGWTNGWGGGWEFLNPWVWANEGKGGGGSGSGSSSSSSSGSGSFSNPFSNHRSKSLSNPFSGSEDLDTVAYPWASGSFDGSYSTDPIYGMAGDGWSAGTQSEPPSSYEPVPPTGPGGWETGWGGGWEFMNNPEGASSWDHGWGGGWEFMNNPLGGGRGEVKRGLNRRSLPSFEVQSEAEHRVIEHPRRQAEQQRERGKERRRRARKQREGAGK